MDNKVGLFHFQDNVIQIIINSRPLVTPGEFKIKYWIKHYFTGKSKLSEHPKDILKTDIYKDNNANNL